MVSPIDEVIRIIRDHQRFVLTTHVNPDGDGIGSEIALAEWLMAAGKQAAVLNHSPVPAVYRFLDPHGLVRTFTETGDARTIAEADVIVVMDTNHPDRLQSMKNHVIASNAAKICIDHHLDPDPFAEHYVLDEDATSTGEIIYRLLRGLGGTPITPLIAQGLYCAIMTDTGSFRYPRVDPETHTIVAHLIACGADPVAIYSEVYERWTGGRIHLLGEMLAGLKTEADGRLAYVTITQEMLTRTGTTEEDSDNFTTYPMSMAGVMAGILFLELSSGLKISFRSKGDIPINELAKEFGGNGHRNAAGARIHGETLDATRNRVLRAALKYLPTQEQQSL